MKLIETVGATSRIWQIFIADSSSTTGAGLTGLVFNSGSLTAYYHRDTDTTATAITLVTMTVGTFTSGGFKEIDATNMPGWYQFCPPNAAIAAGAKSVALLLKGATNMAPLPIEVELVAFDLQTATQNVGVAASVTADVGITQAGADKVWNTTARTLTGSQGIKKNTAKAGFMFLMTDSTTHAPKTGVTVTAQRALNGGAFAASTNAPTEIANGWYTIDLSAADLNGDTVALRFTGTGADALNISIVTGA